MRKTAGVRGASAVTPVIAPFVLEVVQLVIIMVLAKSKIMPMNASLKSSLFDVFRGKPAKCRAGHPKMGGDWRDENRLVGGLANSQ